ncbi:restriction endonuclease subunit S [[Eubacterium] rectale]|uniref:restriction endonuclease subunit S n=1 Tax=Agathobacter rectalis TaxID=39491 RepID=UPI00156F1095|nr:restriction endonuclease subunit S [Agathobacter rectalis]NSI71366.1 restriction endonuclease subunit S [Agathobacter rectalis]NSI76368.1 restriction endonuclease subunit S [Agathobacter rectalis]NSI91440.1 restriction endonuclease subunit S [Agathobacter rectalis]
MRVKLKDIFDLQMGKTPSRSNLEYWNTTDYKWISIADLTKTSKYIFETKEYLSKSAIKDSGIKVIPANTVVMSFKLSIGKTAITKEDMYSNEAIMAFKDKHVINIIPEYIFYLFKYKNWEECSNKAVMGKTLNKATLSEIEVEICSIEKQRQIVNILDKIMSAVDGRKQELQLLDELIKARFVEMFGDPVSNPYGYDKVALSDLADIKIGPFGSLLHKEDYIDGGHPLLNPSHIVDGKVSPDDKLTISDEKYEELSAYQLKTGDVVMGRRGEMGRCAVVPEDGFLCGTGSMLIRTKGEVTADYIQKIISFPSFKKTIEDMAVGQTMPNLNVPIVSGFQIIKPPMEVQDRYYAFAEQVNKSKVAVQKALDETQILFDSLMQKYFG